MYRIGLVNMPFAALNFPSLALTQLESVTSREYPETSIEIRYLHHDFAHLIGLEDYQHIANDGRHFVSGVGDWLFRQIAFPGSPDNADDYLQRYYPQNDPETVEFRRLAREIRDGMKSLLDELIDRYELDGCDLVGFTSMFQQNVASMALARRLKDRNPDIVTVLGGANCEAPMGQAIAANVEQLDFVVSGHALKNFPQLVGHLLAGEEEACQLINGIFTAENRHRWPAEDGTTTVTLGAKIKPVGDELDLDQPVPLNYDGFMADFERNFPDGSIVPFLMFETSRGCWWGERAHCTFCGLNGQTMAYRAMSPDLAVAQFERLFDHSDRVRHLLCVDNILPTEYLTDVFPRVQPPEDQVIFYEVKADLKDEDLAVMRQAGVRLIQPGIEALASSTLTLMRKGITSPQNVSLLISCLRHDVFPVWNLLVGFPKETGEVYSKYCDVMPQLVHLPPPSGAYPVRFDRFSPYFVQAEDFGLQLKPYDWYQMVYPFDDEVLEQIAYYFMDQNSTAEYFVELVTWIQKMQEGIAAWQEAWTSEGRRPPELYCEEGSGGRRIVDTRSGDRLTHSLSAEDSAVLASLVEPRRLADVVKEHPGVDVAASIEALVEKGLAFEDRGRAISLVLARKIDDAHYYSTTLDKVNGQVPDDGGFDPRQVRSPELVT